MRSFRKSLLLLSILAFIMVSLLMSSCECKHEYGEYQVTENATCIKVGVKEAICNLCGEKEFVEIPKDITAHAYGEWIVDSEPNCILAGAKHRVCSLCNDIDAQAMAENENYHTSLNAWQTIIEPTCSSDGKQERECACGYKESAILPKLTEGGHTYGEWAISIEPTCSSEGQRIRYCLDCEKPQAEKLTALDEGGHSFGEWYTVLEPTCSAVGTKMRDCAYCENKEESEIPILTSGGHDFGAWQTTKEPTCSTEGEQKRICSRCNVAEYDTLSKLDEGGHAFGAWYETIKATCDTEGEKRRDCSLCESYFETNVIEKLPIVYTITLDIDGKESVVNLPADGIYSLTEPTKLGYVFKGWLDDDREFNASGIVTENKKITASFELCETKTFNELKTRIDGGVDKILLGDNIILTDTIYVTGNTEITSKGNYTLTRDAQFLGDLFVLGEDNLGNNLILKDKKAQLSIKPEENSSIVIDGNKSSLTEKVNGTVFFMTNGCTLNIYDGVVIQNHKKLGNEKILDTKYALNENELIGGSVAIINDGVFNIYGGVIKDNEVNLAYNSSTPEEEKVEGYKNSSYGGVIYNAGTVNVYGGEVSGNKSSYGGFIFNGREFNVEAGTIKNNEATSYGGVMFASNASSAITYLGSMDGDNKTINIVIQGNTAKGGGALYAQNNNDIVIYGNTLFDSNEATGKNGGAICNTSGQLQIFYAEFKNNTALYYGGAVYYSYSSEDAETPTIIKNAVFENNSARGGGAISLSGSKMTVENVSALGNKSTSKGGGFAYLSKSTLDISSGSIGGSVCDGSSGGAFYLAGSVLNLKGIANNRITISANTTTGNGGVICGYIETEEIVKGQDAEGNDIIETISTRSTVNISYVDFKNNTSTTKSPYGGGVIYASNTDVNADNSIFELNSAIYGGAISLFSSSTLKGDVLSFVNNIADANGGVMYTSKSTVELSNVTLSDNSAKGYTKVTETVNEETGEITTTEEAILGCGGALYINSNSTFKGTNIVAVNNNADNGGFMYSGYSSITIDGDSDFIKNTATSEEGQHGGGAFYLTDCTGSINGAELSENTAANGGAIAIFQSASYEIKSCTFDKNTVTKTGGTFYINTSYVTIDGCTVTGSNASDNGGIIYSTSSKGLTISNSTFEKNNGASGLIYLTKTTLTSTNDKYLENSSKYGVYYINTNSVVTINNGTMNDNTATKFGTCIYIPNGTLTINGLTAKNNIAKDGNGGVINISSKAGVTTTVTINNATFEGNKAKSGGAISITCDLSDVTDEKKAVSILTANNVTFKGNIATLDSTEGFGGAIYVNNGASVELTDATFTENESAHGGAIGILTGSVTVNGIYANGNKATGYSDGDGKKSGNGGVISVAEEKTASITIENGTNITQNVFSNNFANGGGGAIYIYNTKATFTANEIIATGNSSVTNHGGALYFRGSSVGVDIEVLTLTDNTAGSGKYAGGAYLYALNNAQLGTVSAKNNTSGGNGGAFYVGGSAKITIDNLAEADGNAVPSGKYYGGFVYITGSSSSLTINAGTLGKNTDYKGDGIVNNGGKLYINLADFTYNAEDINGTITDISEGVN